MDLWQIGQIPEEYYSAEMEVVPLDDTPNVIIKGVQFESRQTWAFEKASCRLQLDLFNQGPGRVTEVWVKVRIIEKGKGNRLLAEYDFMLDDLMEGEARTETLSFKSLIKENSEIEISISGNEIYHSTIISSIKIHES